jgi:glycosyltransferase involved in cell wall biosynthesis
MKVAYVVNCYPRVSHTFIRREIEALERLGIEVERYTLRRDDDALVDEADLRELERTREIIGVGLPRLALSLIVTCALHPLRAARALALVFRIGLRSDRGLFRHFAYWAEACVLRGWLAASGADHVHAHFGTNSTTVAMLCHVMGGPSYSFTAHGPTEFDEPKMQGLQAKIEHARFVIGISHYACSQMFRRCGHAHWSKIHVVRCGLDENLLAAQPVPFPAQPRIASVARLNEQKGQLLLIEALARLAREGVEFELVLVGDGELRQELERLIERRGLHGSVSITGWADAARVRRELDAARFLVLPSFAEGLPVVLMEAFAVGRPVLTTYIAGITELVSSSCGWLVPAGSVDALVDALRTALATEVRELARMGLEGQARVRKQHNIDSEALKLRALFEQALAPAGAASPEIDRSVLSSALKQG